MHPLFGILGASQVFFILERKVKLSLLALGGGIDD
jgi:hypothetical protein